MTDTSSDPATLESIQPVSSAASSPAGGPSPGIALCLSGGGYRAIIFHVGALLRLNQLGFLKKLARVSSVSGGSFTAGVLALAWKNLSFNENGVAGNLEELLTRPIRRLANTTIDQGSIYGPSKPIKLNFGDVEIAWRCDKHNRRMEDGKTLNADSEWNKGSFAMEPLILCGRILKANTASRFIQNT
jgi:hypothetical protein